MHETFSMHSKFRRNFEEFHVTCTFDIYIVAVRRFTLHLAQFCPIAMYVLVFLAAFVLLCVLRRVFRLHSALQ